MNRSQLGCTVIAIASLAMAPVAGTVADPSPTNPDTGKRFLDRAEMRDWLADGERGIWIQMRSLRWFYARLTGRCPGLDATNSLAFGTPASGHLDRMTSVLVPGHGNCTVQRLAPSPGPAKDRNAKVVLQPQTQ
jgi:hypothetical protein